MVLRAIAGLFGGGLAGCGFAGGAAVSHAPIVRDGAFLMPDGARLPYRVWSPSPRSMGAPAGVLLALHGFNDSRDAWELPAPVLADAGWLVYAPDQRGFGQTSERGRWPGGGALADDAGAMLRQLRRIHDAPVAVMGESMGAAVVMCASAAGLLQGASGLVLVAPALWGRDYMGALLRVSLWAASHGLPGVAVVDGGPVRVWASDNLSALRRLSHDPLTLHTTRLDSLRLLVDLMDDAQRAASNLRQPALCLYGGRDELVPPDAIIGAWARMPDVTRAYYASGRHLLLRDIERMVPLGDILAWLPRGTEPLPSGADRAALRWLAGWGRRGAASAAAPPDNGTLSDLSADNDVSGGSVSAATSDDLKPPLRLQERH